MKFVWALLCAVLTVGATQADDAAVARKIVRAVERDREAAIALLEKAVNINSGTLNFDGIREVGDLFKAQFETLGFRSTWVDGAPFGRAGHLVLERPGKGPRILLIGHLDTVFERSHPFQRAERIDAHTLRGPGAADMKGGIVVALTALRALRTVGSLDNLYLTLVLNGDEENIGDPQDLARAALIQAAQRTDVALGLENADDDPRTAVVARRSSSHWQLTVQGRAAHSSRIFSADVGAGAAYELARILNAFYSQLHEQRYLTFSPGVVLAGSNLDFDHAAVRGSAVGKTNIVADRAVALGDLRALSREQLAQATATMERIAAASLPHTQSTLTFKHNYPPMPPTPGNQRLLEIYDRVSRTLGHGPVTAVDPTRAGAADISFAATHVRMNLDGLGLLGGHAHTAQEFADLRTFKIQAERLALLLYRLAREKPLRP
jgi:glutamate carboxypeptidase